jgi:hypothetical protein
MLVRFATSLVAVGQFRRRRVSDLNIGANSCFLSEGRELVECFQGVSNPVQRRSILNLIRFLAGEEDQD